MEKASKERETEYRREGGRLKKAEKKDSSICIFRKIKRAIQRNRLSLRSSRTKV